MKNCAAFLDQWTDDPMQVKPVFELFKSVIDGCECSEPSFKARPGVSYSLRCAPQGSANPFVILDVVDDDPTQRWLSICFYDEQITDPDEMGDWVPEGLGGKDARCFDVDSNDPGLVEYVQTRIAEAWKSAQTASN